MKNPTDSPFAIPIIPLFHHSIIPKKGGAYVEEF
jgi:hypothetical protein